MKIPRNVSGTELSDVLCRRWQYLSHIILETSEPSHQRIAIPAHRAILRTAAEHKGVSRDEIIATL
jgi:hypothetical protein